MYLSHEVQKIKLLIRSQAAQRAETCIKVSFMSFYFQIFTVPKNRNSIGFDKTVPKQGVQGAFLFPVSRKYMTNRERLGLFGQDVSHGG